LGKFGKEKKKRTEKKQGIKGGQVDTQIYDDAENTTTYYTKTKQKTGICKRMNKKRKISHQDVSSR
jgi:hypothetical protein